MSVALIIIDYQEDFCEDGALPVPGARSLKNGINDLVSHAQNHSWLTILTRDWHPENHSSFNTQGGPWPPHCIENSNGANFALGLIVPRGSEIISKGTSVSGFGYSPFEENTLFEVLQNNQINQIVCCGLALEYCIKSTCIDALSLGLKVNIVRNCVGSLSKDSEQAEKVWNEMRELGCRIIHSVNELELPIV